MTDRFSIPKEQRRDFNWPEWARENAKRLLEPGGIEGASLDECRKLYTAYERQDRFCENTFTGAAADGTIGRLRSRIDELLAGGES